MGVVGKLQGGYDSRLVEDWAKRFWTENRVYEKVKKKASRQRKTKVFIDGPPYPSSGLPHVGTAWNKVLKDAFLRYWRMRGYNVTDRPGYDCHGLPIEVMVEKKLGVRVKKDIEKRVGVSRFIEECRSFALKNLSEMSKWFSDLGVFMDWENPYLTLDDDYIEKGWWLIKKSSENGLLDNEQRIVYWCPRCSTTLAEYEIVYKELEDPSIIVEFPLIDIEGVSILVWTTTPWTLPSNTFVMAHPEATYVQVEIDGKNYILAKERLEWLLSCIDKKKHRIVREFKGRELEGLRYRNPLEKILDLQRRLSVFHKIVMAPEYVTLTEGTGFVHSAPGHGFEDYQAGKKIGLKKVVSPVDDEGRFTGEAGKYSGIYVKNADNIIISDLRSLGALVCEGRIKHRYPTCWRCGTPVILRATHQWILRVTKMKQQLLREAEKVNWIPEWSLARLKHILDNLQDWVLSRQRYWGTPLPIWVCPRGHKYVVGNKAELESISGQKIQDLHRPWIDMVKIRCPVCGEEMKRIPDVADVWFDSGIAFYASRKKATNGNIEADFITEGHDQIRGWFFSQLRSGVIGFGRAPYKNVLVHGFVLDEQGREMHKSLGNYVGTDEVIEKVGRDPFRIWVLQHTPWEDLRFSWKGLDETIKDLSIIWNVYVFASSYMSLDEYDPIHMNLASMMQSLRLEDKWALSRINSLIREVTKTMEEYRIHEAARMIVRFMVEDVSRWYIRLIRPRVWIEENTPDKLAAYSTLYYVLERWLRIASPFIPFLTEMIYQRFLRPSDDKAPLSIHLCDWPLYDETLFSEEIEKTMEKMRELYVAASAARMKAGLKQRLPVREIIIYTDDPSYKTVVDKEPGLLKNLLNTREIRIKPLSLAEEMYEYTVTPQYKVLGPRFKDKTNLVIEYIRRHADIIAKDLTGKNRHIFIIDGKEYTITPEDVKIEKKAKQEYVMADGKGFTIAVHRHPSAEEIADGLARDLVRRIQVMRKELNLPLDAKIKAWITTPHHRLSLLEKKKEYISREVRAESLEISHVQMKMDGYRKEWDIGGERYIIIIKPI